MEPFFNPSFLKLHIEFNKADRFCVASPPPTFISEVFGAGGAGAGGGVGVDIDSEEDTDSEEEMLDSFCRGDFDRVRVGFDIVTGGGILSNQYLN